MSWTDMEYSATGRIVSVCAGGQEIKFSRGSSERISGNSSAALRGNATQYKKPYVLSLDPLVFDVLIPGCFTKSLDSGSNVRFLKSHDTSFDYGSTDACSLVLADDENGLSFQLGLGSDTASQELADEVESGALSRMSIGIFPQVFDFVEIEGCKVRRVAEAKLTEISAVRFPAIANTSVFKIYERTAQSFCGVARSSGIAYEAASRRVLSALSKLAALNASHA
jgi:HK97 family phage prohead protease